MQRRELNPSDRPKAPTPSEPQSMRRGTATEQHQHALLMWAYGYNNRVDEVKDKNGSIANFEYKVNEATKKAVNEARERGESISPDQNLLRVEVRRRLLGEQPPDIQGALRTAYKALGIVPPETQPALTGTAGRSHLLLETGSPSTEKKR